MGLVRETEPDRVSVLYTYLGYAEEGDEEGVPWPASMLPFAYHGCLVFSCVDLETGRVYEFDGGGHFDEGSTTSGEPEPLFVPEAESLEAWFESQL